MTFKPPGGELTFWSATWILFGVGALVLGVMGNPEYYFLGALVGLPAIGIWLQQRWCGYLFAAILTISIPLGLVALFLVDETTSERIRRLVKIITAGYFAFITFRWAKDEIE